MQHTSGMPQNFRSFIKDAIRKDQGPKGDITSHATVAPEVIIHAECVVKEKIGIVSGLDVFREVFRIIDPTITFSARAHDGDLIRRGDILATLTGSARSIFTGERVALELLRHMSGIATKTKVFVEKVKNTGVVILDTRKVLPGYLDLDKKAVRDGGGTNHRANLSSMGLIKSNHIDLLLGDINAAASRFRKQYPNVPLEIEVRNQKELMSALLCNPERILLDNMTVANICSVVNARNRYAVRSGKKIPLEASGNITLANVLDVARTGVEYISIGALTHSVEAVDICLHFLYRQKRV